MFREGLRLTFLIYREGEGVQNIEIYMDVLYVYNLDLLTRLEKYHILMLRVFVHVYIHHFDRLTELEAEAHSNTLFKHYYYFVKEFQLVDEKEFEPLKELIAKICKD